MRSFNFALAPLLAGLLAACATTGQQVAQDPVLHIAGINDFHGNLEPLVRPQGVQMPDGESVSVPAAGAAWLASAVAQIRAQGEYSLAISAGDAIGASPLASSLFLDEPAIGALNRMGLDFNAVGNHEFDRGWHELERMQSGGCERYTLREPCQVENPFVGADFTFLAANVALPNGRTLFPAYGIREFGAGEDAFSVAVIGLTLRDTPTLVTPSGVAGLSFRDEVETINALVPQIRGRGIETIVVAIHQGGYQNLPYGETGCDVLTGPILAIVAELDPAIDLVISGHTHQTYVCDYSEIDPSRHVLLTSAGYGGSYVTDIALTIDRSTHDVKQAQAHNILVQSEGKGRDGQPLPTDPRLGSITPDPAMADYVARYVAAASTVTSRPVGRISGEARKPGPATEETTLGNLIADAQLAATEDAGAEIALMNNTGIRAALVPAADGSLTYGDIYSAQPFGNTLVTRTYTGAQLLALFEQQVDDTGIVQTFSPSHGIEFAYDRSRPSGERVLWARLNGMTIDPARNYRVTMNSFLAAGGDSFTVFTEGTESTVGPVDLDALEAYLRRSDIVPLPEIGRVSDATPK